MSTGFSAATLLDSLLALEVEPQRARCCAAYSGGLDSTALLQALADLRSTHPYLQLRAVHVNHGLQPQADAWAEHCRAVAARLQVQLLILKANVVIAGGESPEAAARSARYRLLANHLDADELLLTAHHREDQLETLLLQFARGAGVAGLAGMPRRARFGRGVHLRPLLDFSREQLRAFVTAKRLEWIEDHSNEDLRFDRNFLRHRVLPSLAERWPGLPMTAVRTGDHLAEAQMLLDELGRADLASASEGRCLKVPALRALEPARARNLLRHWIGRSGAAMPASATLEQIAHQMLNARVDATPVVEWGEHVIRRYRDRLYLGAPLQGGPFLEQRWNWRDEPILVLPADLGRLRVRAAVAGETALTNLPQVLRVAWRAGGESLRLAANRPDRELRSLYQELGVVPWMRARIPLVYAETSLIAVANLWVGTEFRARDDEQGVSVDWLDHPPFD